MDFTPEERMSQKSIKLTLTPAQKEQLKSATGQDADAVELQVEELEDRIAPARWVRLKM